MIKSFIQTLHFATKLHKPIWLRSITLILAAIILLATNALSQQTQPRPAGQGGDVIMLEEIVIQVAVELPTVVVTIPAQSPEIKQIAPQGPITRMTSISDPVNKTRLADVKISPAVQSKEILANPLQD